MRIWGDATVTCEETKGQGLIKQRDNENAAQSHTQAKVHPHTSERRGVGNKGCHSNLHESPCAPHCRAHGHPSRSLHDPDTAVTRGGPWPPQPEVAGPLRGTVVSLSSFLPPKMCARAVPSLSLPSPNSCFSEMQKQSGGSIRIHSCPSYVSQIASKAPRPLGKQRPDHRERTKGESKGMRLSRSPNSSTAHRKSFGTAGGRRGQAHPPVPNSEEKHSFPSTWFLPKLQASSL